MVWSGWSLVSMLAFAPSAAPSTFHPGVGYVLASAPAEPAPAVPPPRARVPQPPPPALAMTTTGRPPSVLELAQGSRRVRNIALGAAIASQAGMIIYGVATLLARGDDAEQERQRLYGDVPTWDPYPR